MSETISTLKLTLEELRVVLNFEREIVDIEIKDGEAILFLKGRPFPADTARKLHGSSKVNIIKLEDYLSAPKDDILAIRQGAKS